MKTIRNKYTGVLLCTALLLFACSKDNESANRNPEKAILLSPANQLQGVDIENLNLEWQSATDPDGDAVAYDLYLDKNNPPTTKIIGDLKSTTYRIQTKLDFGTAYYWRVTAKDGKGGENESNTGTFTTREATAQELIVGKWLLNDGIVNGTPHAANDCEKKTNFQFSADGILSIEFYIGDPCILDIYNSGTGTYSLPNETTIQTLDGGTTIPIVSLTRTELKLRLSSSQQLNFVRGE